MEHHSQYYTTLEMLFGEALNGWVDGGNGNRFSHRNLVACSTGTAALHLGLETLRSVQSSEGKYIHPEDKVIVPEYTMIACPRAVSLSGLTPVFVDCDDRLLLNVDMVKECQDEDVVAIMPVHIYGRQCDMGSISRIARSRGWYVVEDMAELHGVAPHPDTDVACWSFYRNKIIRGEEGGMVWFKDERRADVARSLRCQGFNLSHDFYHTPRGHNYRLSNTHARLIIDSLKAFPLNMVMRREVEKVYNCYCPSEWMMDERESPWVYDIRIPDMMSSYQTLIIERLNSMGVEARYGFKPMTWQEEYRTKGVVLSRNLPWFAARASEEVVYLPMILGGRTGESNNEALIKLIFKRINECLPKNLRVD